MIKRLKELLQAGKNFCFETTAAGTNYVKYLKEAQSKGYVINLIFLWLSEADLAVERDAKRVSQGGHNIPEATVRKRYSLGIKNLIKLYLPIADHSIILDNSNIQTSTIIVEGFHDRLNIKDPHIWEKIKSSAYA